MPLFKVWSEDNLDKKFVVAENFAKLVSKVSDSVYIRLFHECIAWQGGWFDPLWRSNGWSIWPSKRRHSGEFDQKFSKKSNAPGFARGGKNGRFWNWPVHNSLLRKPFLASYTVPLLPHSWLNANESWLQTRSFGWGDIFNTAYFLIVSFAKTCHTA